ncbi:MAG: radical SAM protein, partial [Candidatus Tectomicrobia bacterium]|nr:radical SAM protein [Candidatus Tectomicrobia bacterium]
MFETIKKQVQRARKHFLVVLIKPTKYDDQGYVMRFLQGVLPSNSLMTLLGLTEDAIHRNILGEDVEIEVETYDETVHKIDPVRIMNRARKRGILRVVACFVGVQTNQFPRAVDLARTFKAEGAGVAIGGFHTSGLLAFFPNEPDLLALEEEGITIVKGEAEGHWDEFLLDAWKGRLKPFYDFSLSPVKLEGQPTPAVDADYLSRFAVKGFSTIDAGRGCIWRCKFCCVINVHGNEMRGRHPDDLVQFVRGAVKNGVRFCFIVDDNFVRNPYWREILEGLIKLKKEEGIHLEFMIQIDLVAL